MSRLLPEIIEVTPVISTSAYSANDQVGDVQELVKCMSQNSPWAELVNLTVIDKASQSAALEVYLFDDLPTVASSDNAALDISDAEMVDKCIGRIDVASASYKALAANSLVTVANIQMALRSALSTTPKIYMIARTSGTPTYTSTSDLVFKFGVRKY